LLFSSQHGWLAATVLLFSRRMADENMHLHIVEVI